jgi:chromosome segregation ATPase
LSQSAESFLQKLPTQTEDSLRQELEDLKAQLDMYAANNPGVIEQYENRKLEIASLEKAIQQREKTEAKIQEKIQTAQDNWQPKLEQLVNSIGERFSTAFDSTCARCMFVIRSYRIRRHRLRRRD